MTNGSFAFPAIIAIVAAVVFIIAVVWAAKRAAKKRDATLMDAFGAIPDADYEIGGIDAYHKYACASGPSNSRIDDITWNDLSMDDVFRRVNACSSFYGEEWLYHLLHELGDGNADRRQALIAALEGDPQKRLMLQKTLRGMGKRKSRLSYYVFHADAKRIPHAWLFVILAALPVAGLILMPFFFAAGLTLAVAAAFINIVIYYVHRLNLEEGLESMQGFSALLHSAKTIDKKLNGLCDGLADALRPFRRLGGSLSGNTRQALGELEALSIFLKAIFLIDLLSYNRVIGRLVRYRGEFARLFAAVGELDAVLSILSFRQSLPHWCAPAFSDKNEIAFSGLYHPLIKNPVTNDGRLGNDSLITGSNASGKSTFLKALAVNSILAQTIDTCCAQSYTLKPCYIATSMALRDDILSGDSYFVTEIKSLKRIVEYCTERDCACFIDEILRGTNTPERLAASTAVLRALHKKDCLCLVASHDVELTRILGSLFDNYHFCETMDGNQITFDYLLKQGPSTTTNAIALLEYMGFAPEIISEARTRIQEADVPPSS